MDLGAPCEHPNLKRVHKFRFWGLLIPTEYVKGIDDLSGEDWYDHKARTIVKELVKADPSLRDKFTENVLHKHDPNYLGAFVQRVRVLRDGNQAKSQ